MIRRILLILFTILICIALNSCEQVPEVNNTKFRINGIIENTYPLQEKSKKLLEGIYTIENGSEDFGNYAVVKSTGKTFSILCQKNQAYFVLNTGTIDSVFFFEGYWRFSQSYNNGFAVLHINKEEGGRSLTSGKIPDTSHIIRGYYSKENDKSNLAITLRYQKPLKSDSAFYILAHRGGGRNSDKLPASENSLEIIKIAESFGANGVELDIQLTKDKVPILFHDKNFSSRLIKGNYLIGEVGNFSFKQIRVFGRLINDEKIPTLEEALSTIIYETNLEIVWLDVKDPEAVTIASALQKKYKDLALSANRNLIILLGIPSDEVYEEYLKLESRLDFPSLCELEINKVKKANSFVWAPRWTDAIQEQQVKSFHDENKKVFVWTLDIAEVIKDFKQRGYFDGILTNYPSVVAFEHYFY